MLQKLPLQHHQPDGIYNKWESPLFFEMANIKGQTIIKALPVKSFCIAPICLALPDANGFS